MFLRRHPPINFKVVGVGAVIIVIIFAFMICVAQAQLGGYLNNSPQYRVKNALFRVNHAGELRLIRLLLNRSHGLYGYYAPGPHGPRTFYPVLDRDGKPLNKRQRIERAAGITGISTAIGAAIDGKRGALIGAMLGGSVAAINDSRYRGDQEQQTEVYSPADPLPEMGGTARKPSGGVFSTRPNQRAQPMPRVVDPTASSSSQILLGYTVENTSKVWILIEVDGVRLLEPVAPGETQAIQLTFGRHNVRGYAQATSDTGTELIELARRMREDGKGWIFFRKRGEK